MEHNNQQGEVCLHTHALRGSRVRTRTLTLCGLMGALSAVLMLFKFPLPFMPPFMSFDFSGIVELIGGFAMGPSAAVGIIAVKLLIKIVMQGTSSAWTGEVQNFLLSCAYVLPAVYLYHRHKSRRSAEMGMAVGTVLCAIVASFTNMYLIIPFYVLFAGLQMEAILSMCTAVNPFVTNELTLVLWGVIPFNLLKNGILSLLTLVLYKRLSPHMKRFLER